MTRGVLRGGRRRRRLAGRLRLAALVLALAAGAAVLASALGGDDDPPGRGDGAVAAPAIGRAPVASPQVGAPPPEAQIRPAAANAFRLRFFKPPRAALLFDLDTGEVLWRLRPRRTLPIASLTKVMTALLVTERAGPRDRVRVTRAALRFSGSGLGVLKRGRRVPVETLLSGLLMVSGNDAAIALAVHVAGSERAFVRLMNERARALGLRCTRFVDAHGLGRGDRSCAEDLAVLTRLAMRNSRIASIARRRQASFRFPIKGGRLFMYTHNPLLRARYRGALGLKTGYTERAGRCFVGVARRGGRTLAVVLLRSPDPPGQAPKLLNAAFRWDRARS
jgi:D-alanyl-D-alanine carboxypeptidase